MQISSTLSPERSTALPLHLLWLLILSGWGCPAQMTHVRDAATDADARRTDAGTVTDGDQPVDRTQSYDSGPGPDPSSWHEPVIDDDLSAELYAVDALPRFDLTLPPAAVAALDAEPKSYVAGSFRYGDTVIDNVGIRLKGQTTLSTLDGKAAFKINFGKFVPGLRFLGLKRMTLNNAVKDPSFMAERLAYRLFRAAGVPAPRANSALVYVNDLFYGVYVNVETEDRTFLARWFDDSGGNLYEGESDLTPTTLDLFDLETNESQNDRSDLAHLGEVLERITPATMVADLSSVLELDLFMRFWALEGIALQRDGYAFLLWGDDQPGNYRLYHDPTADRFVFIPWSLDRAMKPPHMPVTASYTYITYPCLQEERCRHRYLQNCRVVADFFRSLPLEEEARAMREQIQAWVELDPRKPGDMTAFELAFEQILTAIAQQPQWTEDDLAQLAP